MCLLFQMIANAGTIEMMPLVDMGIEDWDRVMSINVRSVMLAYKHAARQMIKQGRGGRIVGALFTPVCVRLVRVMVNIVMLQAPRRWRGRKVC